MQRPIGIALAIAVVVLAGLVFVVTQASSLASADSVRDTAAAACFVTAGVAAVAGGVAAWWRPDWAIPPLVVWIGGTILGFILSAPLPPDLGIVAPIALVALPEGAIAWYLGHRLAREPEGLPRRHHRWAPLSAAATGIFLVVSAAAPPAIALIAVTLTTVLPGDARVAPVVVLPMVLAAFIVGLARRVARTRARTLFVMTALSSSLISLVVVFTGNWPGASSG